VDSELERTLQAMRRFSAALRDVRPKLDGLMAVWAEYEAERAAALFEGRVPPSPEVFYAGRD
jgi:hypothetical protein